MPQKQRPNSAGIFPFSGRNGIFSRRIIASMNSSAMKLRKNAFWKAGRSPESLTNTDIIENPNAATTTYKMPLVF